MAASHPITAPLPTTDKVTWRLAQSMKAVLPLSEMVGLVGVSALGADAGAWLATRVGVAAMDSRCCTADDADTSPPASEAPPKSCRLGR